jgi:glucans biosynthesis protein C
MVSQRIAEGVTPKRERLFYLDWLRVLAVSFVFLYHTLRPFDITDWHVKNADQNVVVTVIMNAFALWGMPLFFVLAGAASYFALRSRPGRQFLRERTLRLLVPLFVGFLLFSPLQAYFEALNHKRFAGSSLQFIPWFVAQPQLSWHAPWLNYPYHLWFLEFLWVCSLIAPLLFVFFRRASGSRVLEKLAAWCAVPGGILLFVFPLALIRITLGAAFPGEHDWGELAIYLTFFVYGSVLFSRPSFVEAIRRQGWIALCSGVLSLALILFAYVAGYLEAWESAANFTSGALIYQVMPIIYSWSWLVFVLACGIRWLDVTAHRLQEANEAVLPIYVLHQPAIVLIAFYVVQWNMGILPKWLVIGALAGALTIGLYALVIRRVDWMRWLFGMKALQRTSEMHGKDRKNLIGDEQESCPADAQDIRTKPIASSHLCSETHKVQAPASPHHDVRSGHRHAV